MLFRSVVEANICAMQTKRALKGEAVNVATGTRISVLAVKKLIEEISGKKLQLEKRSPRLGDVRHTHADLKKARRLIGYKPTIDFETGLRNTIKWFKERAFL